MKTSRSGSDGKEKKPTKNRISQSRMANSKDLKSQDSFIKHKS
ncbi:hypothetical protein DsansV1_C42g0238041 [Dioscorea sansibarensis]